MTKDYNSKSMKTENQVKSDSTSIDIMEQKTNASLKTNSDFFVCFVIFQFCSKLYRFFAKLKNVCRLVGVNWKFDS